MSKAGLSDTLQEGLEAYRIGPKLRALRTAKAMGLAQLGEHTGLSAAMLSRLERGQVFPTLATLLRIAMVFGVGLDHFFGPGEDAPVLEVTRARDRMKLGNTPDGPVSYLFESLDFPVTGGRFQAYLAEFTGRAPASPAHTHPGAEMIYVIDGQLELLIHGRAELLGKGDSIYFDAGFEHSYRATGGARCQVVVVVSPTQEQGGTEP
ncbi:helix-turn-helix domain-containing protein [Cribrihabitans neustonicus]|uniref:helix-turn-helix domain-containing protein n=1 Tax=Cribrihabitans neustonicus TaxID=1429085 RepID=UPI003B594F78